MGLRESRCRPHSRRRVVVIVGSTTASVPRPPQRNFPITLLSIARHSCLGHLMPRGLDVATAPLFREEIARSNVCTIIICLGRMVQTVKGWLLCRKVLTMIRQNSLKVTRAVEAVPMQAKMKMWKRSLTQTDLINYILKSPTYRRSVRRECES